MKQLNRAIARYFLFAFTWIFQRVSYGFVRGFSAIFIFIGFFCIPHQKKVARESLRIAFGEGKTEDEIEAIVQRCFSNLGRGFIILSR